VQTRLAFLTARSSREQAEPAARSAVEGARTLGDAEALLEALYALHFALAGPDDFAERAELTREMVDIAPRCARSDPALIALVDIASDRLTLGDPEGARGYRAEAERIGGANPHPGLGWHLRVYDAGLALLEGRFEEAELDARDAHRLGERIQHPYARGCLAAHVSALAFERGDPTRVLEELSGFAEIPGGPQAWVLALLARARLELGRVDEARQIFAQLAAHDFRDIPRNTRWNTTLVELAALCAELEDRERAKPLLELLSPVRDTHGLLAVAICYAGPVLRALARLEALCGRTRAADRLFDDALAAARALGARPMQARILLEHGRLLQSERDSARARAALSEAVALAATLGMSAVRDRAQGHLAALERAAQRGRD
jgi:tetratricopeptide (TPR) repeat protein